MIYDRAHSAISELDRGMIDWARVLEGASWLHLTGITPALGAGVAAATPTPSPRRKPQARGQRRSELPQKALVRSAGADDHASSVAVWTRSSQTKRTYKPSSASRCLASMSSSGRVNQEAYRDVARRVSEKFDCRLVAITLRESLSASDNGWSAHCGRLRNQSFVRASGTTCASSIALVAAIALAPG